MCGITPRQHWSGLVLPLGCGLIRRHTLVWSGLVWSGLYFIPALIMHISTVFSARWGSTYFSTTWESQIGPYKGKRVCLCEDKCSMHSTINGVATFWHAYLTQSWPTTLKCMEVISCVLGCHVCYNISEEAAGGITGLWVWEPFTRVFSSWQWETRAWDSKLLIMTSNDSICITFSDEQAPFCRKRCWHV